MEKKKDWIVDNLHIKEGGLEDLLFEYADAVIEDYQEKIEGDETLTSVPVARKIDEEVYNLVQAELDKAREEGARDVLERILENIPVCRNLNGYEGEGWIMEDDLRNILSKLTTK